MGIPSKTRMTLSWQVKVTDTWSPISEVLAHIDDSNTLCMIDVSISINVTQVHHFGSISSIELQSSVYSTCG